MVKKTEVINKKLATQQIASNLLTKSNAKTRFLHVGRNDSVGDCQKCDKNKGALMDAGAWSVGVLPKDFRSAPK
ncbi:MAG: hypothetical protein CSB16_02710 [Clostridiales bacterium]|nr:MAG: hypothetical protein CSB16_02710 [Clostridiales bacterium]